MGRRLMEVRTQEDYERALQLFQELGNYPFWLGGNDIEEEGVWVWDSNDEVIDMNRFWYSGEPSDNSEDCIMMWAPIGFCDYTCSESLPYICEFI